MATLTGLSPQLKPSPTLDVAAIREAARGRWRSTLPLIRIAVPNSPKQHGPCPRCGGKDRFRFDDQEGRGTWFCNQCDPHAGDGFQLIQNVNRCTFLEAVELVSRVITHPSVSVARIGHDAAPTPLASITARPEGELGRTLFVYENADGVPVICVQRINRPDGRKTFPQWGRTADGMDWQQNLDHAPKPRPIYRLRAILASIQRLTVFHEGEKACEAAVRAGLPGDHTTTLGGAKSPKHTDFSPMKGLDVVICRDNDKDGEYYAKEAARLCHEAGANSVKVLLLPGLPPKGDVVEWLAAGGTPKQFTALIEQAALVQAAAPVAEPDSVSNRAGLILDEWPRLDDAALHGLAGDLVKAIEPHTESDPAAILVQFLVAFGNCLDRGPHFRAEADQHGMNLNVVLTGETAKGRKGTSWGNVRRVFTHVDPGWADSRILNGLSSGEGLIWAVRDEITKEEPIREKGRVTNQFQTVVVDRGVEDKRLLTLESEFASTLHVMARDGNTLSAVIRQAWDSGNLRTMTKNSPAQATGAHISIIAHITKDELCRLLDATEASNGFCNRFLWVCVKRSKMLPEGGSLSDSDLAPLVHRLREAVGFGKTVKEVKRDEDARAQWRAVYPALSEGKPGLLGGVVSRAEAQVMRLACLYALLDRSYVVTPIHLQAAIALWEYCEASAKYIFGQRLGDPVADELLIALRNHPDGMTRTEIRDLFQRNRKTHEITRGLTLLAKQGLARQEESQSIGRSTERWFAVAMGTTYDLSDLSHKMA